MIYENLKTLFNCNLDIEISNVKINSKEVNPGDLFICRKGINSDGHDFIGDAVQNGTVAIDKLYDSINMLQKENLENLVLNHLVMV